MPRALALCALVGLTACHKGGDADTGDPCIEEEAAAAKTETTEQGWTCEATPDCISLPEAVDKGLVSFVYNGSAIALQNLDETQDVCVTGWYLLETEASQDSGFGEPGTDTDPNDSGDDDDGSDEGGGGDDTGDDCDDEVAESKTLAAERGGRVKLAPLEIKQFTYGGGGQPLNPDLRTWWCVEETQVTTGTSDFVFNGAHVPGPLLHFATTETDVDGDGVEDHVDGSQTNANIWAYQNTHPVMAVGRVTNTLTLLPGGSHPVTIEVQNMGAIGASTTVTETLPPGVTASDFSLEPDRISRDLRGRQLLEWDVVLDGRIPTGSSEHTDYDQLDLSFQVTLADDAACPLRREGVAIESAWQDADDVDQASYGAPLIVDCCVE